MALVEAIIMTFESMDKKERDQEVMKVREGMLHLIGN